ncbi:hypothetical protein CXF64_19975 [Pseudoalteromonas sp. GutCa3]|nr:hypothetical protein CXF64_19975 [Pseudoalteromonas sp. GutCa3]
MGNSNRFLSLTFQFGTCKSLFRFGFITLISLTSITSYSNDLIEVGRIGNTILTDKYYKNIDIQKSISSSSSPVQAKTLLDKSKDSISKDIFFPLTPKVMQPGIMKSFKFNERKTVTPFAVVGTDNLSLKWLNLRRNKLNELNAPIFVVQARSFSVIADLASSFDDLNFVPSSGDGIGADLNVGSYPFLVTEIGVFQ